MNDREHDPITETGASSPPPPNNDVGVCPDFGAPSAFALRPYQREAANCTMAKFRAQDRATLVVMPTGTGKTIVFAECAKRARAKGRVLVLAHREELLTQNADKIRRATGLSCEIEAGDRRVDVASLPDVVVASVPTLARKARRERFAPDAFVLVIVDEAHHVAAASYRGILDYFTSAKVLGVTATPERLDKRGLGAVFDSVAYVYEIRDAIEQGWLVPIKQRRVTVEGLKLDTVRTKKNGDFDDEALAEQFLAEQALHSVAAPLAELAGSRPTIVFTPTVAVAGALAAVLGRYVGSQRVRAIDGNAKTDARSAVVRGFHAGEFQFLVNCALFTEGFDAPHTACVAVARPTQSRALYAQMVGRGTRLHAESEKDHLLVIDFTDNSTKHKLVTVADILDGNRDEAVRERVAALLDANPEAGVLEALDAASAQIAAERRARMLCETRYQTQNIDPFMVLGADSRAGRWGGIDPTDKQAHRLRQNGIDPDGLDRGQASSLITEIIERFARGLCTYKQAKVLARYGLNPDVSFDDAQRAIDAIQANGWKAPGHLYDDPVLRPSEPFTSADYDLKRKDDPKKGGGQ